MQKESEEFYEHLLPCMADKRLAIAMIEKFGVRCFQAKKKIARAPDKNLKEISPMGYIIHVIYKSGREETKKFPSIKNKKYMDYLRDCNLGKDAGIILSFKTSRNP